MCGWNSAVQLSQQEEATPTQAEDVFKALRRHIKVILSAGYNLSLVLWQVIYFRSIVLRFYFLFKHKYTSQGHTQCWQWILLPPGWGSWIKHVDKMSQPRLVLYTGIDWLVLLPPLLNYFDPAPLRSYWWRIGGTGRMKGATDWGGNLACDLF